MGHCHWVDMSFYRERHNQIHLVRKVLQTNVCMTTSKGKDDVVVENCSLAQVSCPQTEPNLRAIYQFALPIYNCVKQHQWCGQVAPPHPHLQDTIFT